MALTYDSIYSITINSNVSEVTFLNIPQNYTDLILVCNLSSVSGTRSTNIKLNSDNQATWSWVEGYSNGSSALSTRSFNTYGYALGYNGGYPSDTVGYMSICNFMNYSNTSMFKTILSKNSNANNAVGMQASLWKKLEAINSITVNFDNVTSIKSGSILSLYGIKAAT